MYMPTTLQKEIDVKLPEIKERYYPDFMQEIMHVPSKVHPYNTSLLLQAYSDNGLYFLKSFGDAFNNHILNMSMNDVNWVLKLNIGFNLSYTLLGYAEKNIVSRLINHRKHIDRACLDAFVRLSITEKDIESSDYLQRLL